MRGSEEVSKSFRKSDHSGYSSASDASKVAQASKTYDGQCGNKVIEKCEDESIPSSPETVCQVEPSEKRSKDSKKRRGRKKTWPTLLCLAVIFCVATITVVVVFLSRRNSSDVPVTTMTLVPTFTPTKLLASETPSDIRVTITPTSSKAPSPSPTSHFEALESKWIALIQSRISSITFDDPLSPQRRGMDWLLSDGFATSNAEEDERILQRFALATVLFAFNRNDLLTIGTSECDWTFLICNGDATNELVEEWTLQESNLSGTIPREIGLLSTGLLHLNFVNNTLQGAIPTELGVMTALTELNLWMNQLHGSIPSELGLLTNLEYFDFEGNDLTGSIPSTICDSLLLGWLDTVAIACECDSCQPSS